MPKINRLSHLVLLLAVATGCAPKAGYRFNLAHIEKSWPQVEVLKEAEITVNKLIQSDCMKMQLNDLPKEYFDLKNNGRSLVFSIQNILADNALASNSGYGISLTWDCFQNKRILNSVIIHEITHALGYQHPRFTDGAYESSFPVRAQRAAYFCYQQGGTL